MRTDEVYGGCAKHPGQNMVNCAYCDMETDLQKVFIPKRVKQKISPYKPVIEINEDNAMWIQHCVAKRSKKAKYKLLNISIEMEKIKVRFEIEEDYRKVIFRGESKNDINEAIRSVIDQFATHNLARSLGLYKK